MHVDRIGQFVVGTLLALLGLSATAAQAQTLYGVSDERGPLESILYKVDPATGAATEVGTTEGYIDVTGIAIHPVTRVMYAAARTQSGSVQVLLTIDPATGVATQVGLLNMPAELCPGDPGGPITGVAFGPDGTLYGAGKTLTCARFGTFNLATGAWTPLGPGTTGLTFGGGIAFSPAGVLYYIDRGIVATVNLSTGALTTVATVTPPDSCDGTPDGMAAHPVSGTMFLALKCPAIADVSLATVNTATGVITEIGPTADFLTALAFEPVSSIITPPLTAFQDVRRANDITIGLDLGGTGHQALNFGGTAGAAGDTWITVYDPEPSGPAKTYGSVRLTGDVLVHTFNNKKGGGLLALYNQAVGKKGLALMLYNAGNTDTLVLATVDQAGKLVPVQAVSLGSAIVENQWYRVTMDVAVGAGKVSVLGTVSRHEDPTDPTSEITTQIGPSLNLVAATLGAGALVGVDATGEVGVLAAAANAANSTSVTNVTIEPQGATGTPTVIFD